MEPTIKEGQEILVSNIPYLFNKPKVNDLIAFKDGNQFIIKRLKQIKDGKYLVKGDNKKDSKNYGWIDKKDIIGKVIYTHP